MFQLFERIAENYDLIEIFYYITGVYHYKNIIPGNIKQQNKNVALNARLGKL